MIINKQYTVVAILFYIVISLNINVNAEYMNDIEEDTIVQYYYSGDTIHTGLMKQIHLDSLLNRSEITEIGLFSNYTLTYSQLKIELGRLSKFPMLKYLTLTNIVQDSIPLEILQFKNLEQIEFICNVNMDFDQIFTVLSKLPKLKALSSVYNHKNYIPVSICKIKSLVALDISHNTLDSLPFCIGELNNLKIINLSEGHYSDMQKIINPLLKSKSLEELCLASLFLKKIPNNIGDIKNLKKIDFFENILDTLPCSLANRGIEIDLGWSRNTVIPDCFKQK